MLKEFKEKTRVYIRTFYVRTRNLAMKRHFMCSIYVKKTKKMFHENLFSSTKLSFLHKP
jgi:hypothetical protein